MSIRGPRVLVVTCGLLAATGPLPGARALAAQAASSPPRWVLQAQGGGLPQLGRVAAWFDAIGLKCNLSDRYAVHMRFDFEPAIVVGSRPEAQSGIGIDADFRASSGKRLRQYAGVGPAVAIQRGQDLARVGNVEFREWHNWAVALQGVGGAELAIARVELSVEAHLFVYYRQRELIEHGTSTTRRITAEWGTPWWTVYSGFGVCF